VSRRAPLVSPSDPATLVGTVLDGRYELVGHLATGGMGAVFRARHVHLRKDVAVKVLRPELSAAPDLVERFRREAEIAGTIEHDNLVRVTDFGRSDEGLLFLVMDLLTGESLFEVLRRERILPPPRAVSLLWQICSGLQAAHEHGVVHRDLKPENVFLARSASGREVVKLLDFGIAKLVGGQGESATQTGIVVGTPEYLSPEQAMGLPVDCRADVYTVGLIAFRMLTGQHPFRADDPRGLLLQQASTPLPSLADANPELHAWPALCAAVAGACEKDPARRPGSAAELGQLLASAVGPAFVLPPGATPSLGVASRTLTDVGALTDALRRAARGRRRRRWLVAAGAALLLAGALAAAAFGVVRALRPHPIAQAQELLGAGRPELALAAAEAALRSSPKDPQFLLLRARALRRIPGRGEEALEAYAAAQATRSLELADYQEVVRVLREDRRLADRAARLLRDGSPLAVPAVAELARAGSPAQRLRAMAILRDLEAENAVDRVAVYGALLADPDCDVRRAAARRLGELGDSAALPALRSAAAATRPEKKWNLVLVKAPACGSAEAAEAVRKIQRAN
jgi:serine/threonine-protein kinase